LFQECTWFRLYWLHFRRKKFSTVDYRVINYLDKYNFDKAFIGVNGISIEEGFTTPNELEAEVDGKVVKRSKQVFILADETKFGAIAYSNICKLKDVDYIITNKLLNSGLLKDFQKNGVEIIYE